MLKLHGFESLNQHKIFQSKAKEKGMRFTDLFGQNFRPLHEKKTDLPRVQTFGFFFSSLPPRLPKLKTSQEHSNSEIFDGFSLPQTLGETRKNGAQINGFFMGYEHPKSDEL